MPAFEVRDLVKRYPRARADALRGLSLEGEPGQVVGLLGPNGAGKTTAVKCLAGLVRPTSGQALLHGEDARAPHARRHLGYLPEAPRYAAHLTAAELLDREGRLLGLPRAERRARTATLLDRVGLTGQVWSRLVSTYSKGERARLGLALALVGEPSVVLLDEPTDGLDPVGRRAVRDLLRALRDEGRAVLVNTHLLSEAEACCDRVVILKAGQTVAAGDTRALLADAGRRTVYRARLAAPLEAEALAALTALAPAARQEGAELVLPLDDAEAIDGVLDLLRARGARLRELTARATLEDVFLDAIGAGDAPTPPEAAA
ncbi:MAG: ABC transporter ATP-binding protein [Planctomycetes bacterium]|nr:ABC transporter ATP-binding protein [Planctomycetota bacterium]